MQSQLPASPTVAAIVAGLAAARAAHLLVSRDCDLRTVLVRGDPRKFHGRVVWLCAAHRPLSGALARRLARLGACLVLSGPPEAAPLLQSLARELDAPEAGPGPSVALDLSTGGSTDMSALAHAAADEFGRLDLVVIDTTDSGTTVSSAAPSNEEKLLQTQAARAVEQASPQLQLTTGWGAAIVHVARMDCQTADPLFEALRNIRVAERRIRVVDVRCGAVFCESGSQTNTGTDSESGVMDAAAERVLAAVSGGLARVVLGTVGERWALWMRGWERGLAQERVPLLMGGNADSSGNGGGNDERDDDAARAAATSARVQRFVQADLTDRPWQK